MDETVDNVMHRSGTGCEPPMDRSRGAFEAVLVLDKHRDFDVIQFSGRPHNHSNNLT